MKNIIVSTRLGDNFNQVGEIAKGMATKDQNAEFEFNGVKCIVSPQTNIDWLCRDYMNSWTMGWKTVGPDCVEAYDKKTEDELEKNNKLAEEKREKEREKQQADEQIERDNFIKKVAGVVFECKDIEAYNKNKGVNSDPYGSCILEYAEGWAKLMQVEIQKGKTLAECAENTSFELGFLGITGFMYGAAVATLSTYWKHGDDLKAWHNKKYNHKGDGVVNPAVLTIGKGE